MRQSLLKINRDKVSHIKNSVHNKTINDIVNRLMKTGGYNVINKNIEYGLPGNPNPMGEIDVYSIKRTKNKIYLLLFEVKSTDSIKNKRFACEQLTRHERILSDNTDRIFKFYVTPHKHNIKTLSIEWIKKPLIKDNNYHHLRP